MYFIGRRKKDRDTPEHAPQKRRSMVGVPEYDETLEPSFVFESEESGFIRVKNTRQEADEAVPESSRAPIAIF